MSERQCQVIKVGLEVCLIFRNRTDAEATTLYEQIKEAINTGGVITLGEMQSIPETTQ